ncbi:hypothetical protein ACFX2H_023123 [Malus domestica]
MIPPDSPPSSIPPISFSSSLQMNAVPTENRLVNGKRTKRNGNGMKDACLDDFGSRCNLGHSLYMRIGMTSLLVQLRSMYITEFRICIPFE